MDDRPHGRSCHRRLISRWDHDSGVSKNFPGIAHIGRNEDARTTLRDAADSCTEAFGATHPRCATVLTNLASAEHRVGHSREAIPIAEQALSNEKNGARIEWLTRRKAMRRFLLPGYKDRHIVEDYEREYEAKS